MHTRYGFFQSASQPTHHPYPTWRSAVCPNPAETPPSHPTFGFRWHLPIPVVFDEICGGVHKANRRISANLKIKRDTLQIYDGRLRAIGIAGVIQLTRNVELEIIPKFLGNNVGADWKATLYLLSTLSKHGSILTAERITASTSYLNSLYEIAGRVLAQEYLKCRRKPLRQYKKERFWDYAIDGEMELSVLFEQHPDGIEQSRIRFDRLNAYNATIREAMKVVQPFTTASQVKNILSTAVSKDSQLTPLYLLDAKYKLVKNATTGEVERDDLYEAFAFCSATDTNEIVLVYPADDPANIPGHVKKCSTYYVKDVMIHVVQVAFGSIKEKGGIYAFSANLCSGIEAVLKSS